MSKRFSQACRQAYHCSLKAPKRHLGFVGGAFLLILVVGFIAMPKSEVLLETLPKWAKDVLPLPVKQPATSAKADIQRRAFRQPTHDSVVAKVVAVDYRQDSLAEPDEVDFSASQAGPTIQLVQEDETPATPPKIDHQNYFPPKWRMKKPYPTDKYDVPAWQKNYYKQLAQWGLPAALSQQVVDVDEVPAAFNGEDANDAKEAADEKDKEKEEKECSPIDVNAFFVVSFSPGFNSQGLYRIQNGHSHDRNSYVSSWPVAELTKRIKGLPDFYGPGSDAYNQLPNNVTLDTSDLDLSTVWTLGHGGEGIVAVDRGYLVDGDGCDLMLHENAFEINSDPGTVYAEPIIVGVSDDLRRGFVEFDCQVPDLVELEQQRLERLALAKKNNEKENNKQEPVDEYNNSNRLIQGMDLAYYPGCAGIRPTRLGGDCIDFAELKQYHSEVPEEVRYIRLRGAGDRVHRKNEYLKGDGDKSGPDIDALIAVNGCRDEVDEDILAYADENPSDKEVSNP